jgi:D-beta-D-heptose 7-phosphate kinase/D-beta-D-heptose 1-phosphate adenosyltransferase
MLDWLKENRQRFSGVLLSDYNKGMFWDGRLGELLECLAGLPTLAGPKPENIDKFRGVEMVTLNALEARVASGHDTSTDEGLRLAGQALLDRTGCRAVLVTLGERGMALFENGRPMRQVPALASQVYDVSGAGDTVLSVVGLSRAVGVQPEEAMRLASHAAAVVVRKVGTATVDQAELLASLDRDQESAVRDPQSKILEAGEAEVRLAVLRAGASPPRVVFTNGCFDLLHVGHLRTLLAARQQGDLLVVGLNSDRSVQALKGPERPLNTQRERAELLAGLECVDLVVIFDEDTPLALLEQLRPDVHVKGGDYREEDLPEASLVRSWGGRVVLTGVVPERSTTLLAARIRNGS